MSISLNTPRNRAAVDLYALFWKWHLYAGLFVSPVLCVVAITGALLVFAEEIEHKLAPELWIVQPNDERIADAVLVDFVASAYPGEKIFSYVRPAQDDRSYLYWLTGDYRGLKEVFVDPYAGKILGDRLREKSFMRITEQLHRRLLTGTWGSIIVDATTGWTIVLLLTGLYLWWPKNMRGLVHGLTVRLRGSLKKINWQLHNTLGFYSFVFLLLLCLTGMVVSEVTGTMYRATMFSAGAFPQALITPPKSNYHQGDIPVSLDAAVSVVQQQLEANSGLDIRLPIGEEGSYLIATKTDGSNIDEFHAWIVDQYSGEIIEDMPWDSAHVLMKIRSLSLAIHFGSIYGLPTKILALVSCLAVPVICITGYLIWWWKRPAKARQTDCTRISQKSLSAWCKFFVILYCLIFPAVGMTVAIAYAIEWE